MGGKCDWQGAIKVIVAGSVCGEFIPIFTRWQGPCEVVAAYVQLYKVAA